jgi:rod shape-determining protein MreD
MIMRPGQQLLLPAKAVFIWGSLMVALGINFFLNMSMWGRAAWSPDLLALLLAFWTIHQPQRIGIGIAFCFGLLLDVHQGAMLGQHALAYTLLSFLSIAIHRRLLWFTVPSQAFQVFPLFAAAHAIELAVRMLSGSNFPGLPMLLAPVLESLLWPVVSVILLMPQRRAPDPDAHRPL